MDQEIFDNRPIEFLCDENGLALDIDSDRRVYGFRTVSGGYAFVCLNKGIQTSFALSKDGIKAIIEIINELEDRAKNDP